MLLLILACLGRSGDDTDTPTLDSAGEDSPTDTQDTGTQDTGSPQVDPLNPALDCAAWPESTGSVKTVSPGDDLQGIVAALEEGDTLLFEDGTYSLNGSYLWVATPNVTLRGASGDASKVILDGGFKTTQILTIVASDVSVSDLTFYQAWTHGVHVTGGGHNVRLHRIVVLDPGEQGIKVNTTGETYADDGEISCSRVEMTDNSRDNAVRNSCYTGGIDMHQTRGWVIRDNEIRGFWCESGLSEHGIHLWRANADSLIVRNRVENCARGIGIGLVDSPVSVRDHGIAGCDQSQTYYDDINGVIVNNLVLADDSRLFASNSGFDSGIGVYQACNARVLHNTVWSSQAPYSSLEWRFEGTNAEITNNLVSHNLRERTTGTGTLAGNLESVGSAPFVNAAAGELHLTAGSTPVDAGVVSDVLYDFQAQARDGSPDVGAYEL
ncbi:MAG: glycosyl hydrolase family 28-related protein [Myxococcota bacterium]|nr:glycosyl hydrolase family 28-related protein [Myxococcota bacterium]